MLRCSLCGRQSPIDHVSGTPPIIQMYKKHENQEFQELHETKNVPTRQNQEFQELRETKKDPKRENQEFQQFQNITKLIIQKLLQ